MTDTDSKYDRRRQTGERKTIARLVFHDGERVRKLDGFILGFPYDAICILCTKSTQHTDRLFANHFTQRNYQVAVCTDCGTLSNIKELD